MTAAPCPGYPADYEDPPWDGSPEQFTEVVLPARMAALERAFTGMLADMGFADMRFEFVAPERNEA